MGTSGNMIRHPARVPKLCEHQRALFCFMDNKKKFIYYEILAFTIIAGFMVRGGKKIYKPNLNKIEEKKKEEMRKEIKQYLIGISSEYYKNKVDNDQHIKNIDTLKEEIQKKYNDILYDQTFRFGIAQKLLNLYLKYLWALGWIKTPPHCPIDSKISKALGSNYKFAISDDKGEYEEVIKKADQAAKNNGISIIEWETEKFIDANYSKLDFLKVDFTN